MLTPNGFLVMVLHRRISFRRSSGVGWVRAVRIPRPPALLTADASSAYPTHCMPPWTMGTRVDISFEDDSAEARGELTFDPESSG